MVGKLSNAEKEQELLKLAMKRLKVCVSADSDNRLAAIDDLKFVNGEQWDPAEKTRRSKKGRPALQINLLPKFIDQVVGDMLHTQPSVKIHPVNSKSDPAIAKIRQGIISDIEYRSNAKAIYGYAAKQMVSCGYGAWRVLTRYTDDNPFIQEAYLESIRNPFLVYMDPLSKDQNYADARYGFIVEKMSKDDFEDKYPNAIYPTKTMKEGAGLANELYFEPDTVMVAEYFSIEYEEKELYQLEDGSIVDEKGFKELHTEWEEKLKQVSTMIDVLPGLAQGQNTPAPIPQDIPQGPIGQTPQLPQGPVTPPELQELPPHLKLAESVNKAGPEPKIVKKRNVKKPSIRQRIITCSEVLEGGLDGNKVPGEYIPIVLLKGKELNIEGKTTVFSLIRHGKDPQKLINYWNTSAAEVIALAPKTPWVGTAKQFEGYENDYATANVENYAFLKYNVDPEVQQPPQRQQPGNPPVAIFEQIRRGEENLKSVLGMFNADIGAPDSRQTGDAVLAGQKPGDIGTFEFHENFARAIAYSGKILNSMIPDVYDSERDVRIRHYDNSETFVPINTTVGNAFDLLQKAPKEMFTGLDPEMLKQTIKNDGRDVKFNDVTVGKYGVVVSVGPSYTTQRMESQKFLLQLVQAMPQQMAIALDLLVRNMDFKDADALAERLEKQLPPGMIKPKPGQQPAPPPPALIIARSKMQIEQAKVQLAQMKVEQEKIKLEHEKIKIQLEMAKAQAQQNEGKGQVDIASIVEKQAEIREKEHRLELEEKRLELEAAKFVHDSGHEISKLDHSRNMDIEKLMLEYFKLNQDYDLASMNNDTTPA